MFQSVLTVFAALALVASQPLEAPLTPEEIGALRIAAENGDAEAQFGLAFELFSRSAENRSGTADSADRSDVIEARRWARQASGQDHAEAINLQGLMARQGFGQPVNHIDARSHFRRAHSLGSSAASLTLGIDLLMYEEDEGLRREGFDILSELMDRDDAPDHVRALAAGHVGFALSVSAGGVEIDHDRGFALLNIGIEAGPDDPNLNFILARYHESTAGGPIDMPRALFHFMRAAENGHGFAAWRAGMILLAGEAGPADANGAFRMVSRAAELGELDGMISLAVMYALGQGTDIRADLSREWYARAAATGSAHALRGLGMMLVTGEGGEIDVVLGRALLNLAVAGGDQPAQYWLDQLGTTSPQEMGLVRDAEERWLRDHGLKREDLYDGQIME